MDMSEQNILKTLRDVFGFDGFRPHQEGIVRAVVEGRDVFAVMPTGAGKSLCYQLPALLRPGVCLVISPLIALMKDQVDAARRKGIRAAYINSSQSAVAQKQVSAALVDGRLDLLYASPERFALPAFVSLLQSVDVSFVAIDEAHCISAWGHDFRPDYLQLSEVKRLLPGCPIAAFTATATLKVASDITAKLALRDPYLLRASFNRSNLFYEVCPKLDAERQVLDFVKKHVGESGIVYRMTRSSVEETASILQANGIKALPYHAGLDDGVRVANQEAFDRGETDVVVATIAFGMGIDKPNIRYVVHGDLPKNIESYYQETGRAGRDGAPAHCLLLFGYGDVPRIGYFIDQITDVPARNHARVCLDAMVDYGSSTRCRRVQMLRYFDEQYEPSNCGMCDVCTASLSKNRVDVTVEAQMLLSAIVRTGNRFGASHIVDIVKGANTQKIRDQGHDRISTYGVGRDRSKQAMQAVLHELVAQEYVKRVGDLYPALVVEPSAGGILSGDTLFYCGQEVLEVFAGSNESKGSLKMMAPGGTAATTVELLEKGMGFDEVAAARDLKVETIVNHVERYLATGKKVNADIVFSLDDGKRDLIVDVLKRQDSHALKPVYDYFGGDVSYEEIRLARLWMKLQQQGEAVAA